MSKRIQSVGGMREETVPGLVSTIIIFLDAEQFLEEAIESVFAQTYDRWELLLVDDGSTDGGPAIARRYAREHPHRVRYLEHPGHENRGMSAARNLGIRHARGEYIAFLDADDVWLAHKLEQQVAILKACPEAGMLCGASQYWCGWTGSPEDAARDKIVPVGAPQDALVRPPALLTLLYPLAKGAAPCVNSLLVRRSVIKAVNGFEESFRGMYEDQAFLIKVYHTTPVFVSSLSLDCYRQHANSCMSSRNAGSYDAARMQFLTWYESYLLEHGDKGSQAWHAVQRCLQPYSHPTRFFLAQLGRHPSRYMRKLVRPLLRALPASALSALRTGWGRPGIR